MCVDGLSFDLLDTDGIDCLVLLGCASVYGFDVGLDVAGEVGEAGIGGVEFLVAVVDGSGIGGYLTGHGARALEELVVVGLQGGYLEVGLGGVVQGFGLDDLYEFGKVFGALVEAELGGGDGVLFLGAVLSLDSVLSLGSARDDGIGGADGLWFGGLHRGFSGCPFAPYFPYDGFRIFYFLGGRAGCFQGVDDAGG